MRSRSWLPLIPAAILLAASVDSAQAQGISLTGLRLWTGHAVSPVVLVAAEPVQKELGLKSDQIEKAMALVAEHREAFMSEFRSAGFDPSDLRNASDEDRPKVVAEFQSKIGDISKTLHEKFHPKLTEFLDAGQRVRLAELDRQAAGAQVFKNAEVIKVLELSKEQQEKLDALAKDFSGKIAKLFGGEQGEEIAQKFRQVAVDWDAQAAEVLNKEQKEKFAKLKGKAFDFSDVRIGGN